MDEKALLSAISQMMDEKLEIVKIDMAQMMDEKLAKTEKRIISRVDKSDKFLEDCINEAAKDAQTSIKQHEKEWHIA